MKENKYSLFIDGEFVEGSTKEWFEVINPADESLVGLTAKATVEDVEAAVQAAKRAFDNGSWSRLSATKRAEVLLGMAEGMAARQRELANLMVEESGSTIHKATMEVILSINTLKYYADLIRTPYTYEAIVPNDDAFIYSYNFVQREPIGVCAGIVPWNFPLAVGFWKIAPGLAAGNTMVIKVPTEAPLVLMEIAKIAQDAGLPKGVLNIVAGAGRVVGEYLAAHPQVDKISFTGSTGVGKRILELSSASNLKIATLELGGKSANIILEDADLAVAIDGSLFATMLHSGQVCESGTRLLVPKSRYDEVIEGLVSRAKTIKVGDPSKEETGMGPIISKKQKEKIEEYIQIGIKEGAKRVLGEEALQGKVYEKGFWVPPTIFADVNNQMTIAREEIFGPVVSVIPYKSEAEAIAIANDSIYGLAGGVWSKDQRRAVEVAKRMHTGTIWVNSYHLLNPIAPFGGYKQSGLGRELGIQGLLAYTQSKHIHVDLENDGGSRYRWMLP
ncbi:aldehyde dehydrogenase family protein [Pectinatus brassicae]|jgi:betaine-aldehyde dehydrogenase|uniref:Betaine-aldehyde dehydrogenase n=1 Tax=Pectinatus brassicae TaxID=862415 RepID=A0A840UX51_9FIRM|nr:aldehyde dehydrogenase family protein [Pectinatus brassicae]MBB5337434.1 betaine-aldehyde dehydrogenase [Pectinatus brassicae]